MSSNSILSPVKIASKLWLIFHYVVFIGSLLYSLYRFQRSTFAKIPEIYSTDWDTSKECWICWRPRDGTDLEWQIVKQYFMGPHAIWFIGHSAGFYIVRTFFPEYLSRFVIAYTSLVITSVLAVEMVVLMALNCFLYIILDIFLSISFTFLANIPYYILFLVSIFYVQYLEPFHEPGDNLLLQVMMSWLNARCLSASLDRHSFPYRLHSTKYLYRRFVYLFYFPPLLFGPIYHFTNFDACLDRLENGTHRYRTSLPKRLFYIFRIVSWAWFFEVAKQFILSSSFQYYIFLLERFDSWSLAGYGFALTIMFYIKYLVIYGISKAFAELDGFENVIAPPPECIAHMHRTSYLWRRFDQGLYRFLVKYFYKPLTGGLNANAFRKFLAGMVCFGVIALWHGLNLPVLIWVTLNVILSAAEIVGTQFVNFLPDNFRTNNGKLIGQVAALVGAPYLSLAYLSNVFFLSNFESGFLLWTHFYLTDFSIFFVTMFVFWSGNHVCKHINDNIYSRKPTSLLKNRE